MLPNSVEGDCGAVIGLVVELGFCALRNSVIFPKKGDASHVSNKVENLSTSFCPLLIAIKAMI